MKRENWQQKFYPQVQVTHDPGTPGQLLLVLCLATTFSGDFSTKSPWESSYGFDRFGTGTGTGFGTGTCCGTGTGTRTSRVTGTGVGTGTCWV